MTQVKILVEGYARKGNTGDFYASPTCSLITTNKINSDGSISTESHNVLVDPGTNSKSLLLALEDLNLKPENIDIVFLSHYHPDHFLNIRLFPNAEIVDGTMIWQEDSEVEYDDTFLGKDVKRLPTPGHAGEHCSLLVKTSDGVICIAQDVFWWEDGEQSTDTIEALLKHEDQFASDAKELIESRKKVLKLADWIIPGHGKMFKNNAKELQL